MKTILETERLLLRELRQEDFEDACLLLQDPEVMYAYEGPFSRREVQEWLDKQFHRYREDGFGLWAVVEKNSGTLIGQCGLTLQSYRDGLVPEVGYLLRRAYWHQGYATEAARACKEYAFSVLGFSAVYSLIRDTNLPSERVAQRNGMHHTGWVVKYYKGLYMDHKVFRAENEWYKGLRLLRYMHHCLEICAFSTTRQGGVSTGAYASMNCTPYTGDDPQCVIRNQEILLNSLPQRPGELIIPYQTHGTAVLAIDESYLSTTPDERHARLQGIDALITDRPGVCLCISTADCIPVLLYDRTHRAIAAIHAGWRGTVAHIVFRTLEQMHTLYGTEADDLLAAIGPGISRDAFEVGDEVFDAFYQAGFPMQDIAYYNPLTGKHQIDLPLANILALRSFGLLDSQIESCGLCTYTRHEELFSARRLGIKSGRMLTGIMISNENKKNNYIA